MGVRTGLLLVVCLAACAGCGQKKSTDELLKDLNSSQEKDQIIAVRLLPQRKADAVKVVPGLIEALKNNHSDVRWSAAIGLGSLGDKARDAIPALQEAESDRDARVREAARVALSRIDPTQFSATPKKEGSQGK
jgi:HEAT repeat protein